MYRHHIERMRPPPSAPHERYAVYVLPAHRKIPRGEREAVTRSRCLSIITPSRASQRRYFPFLWQRDAWSIRNEHPTPTLSSRARASKHLEGYMVGLPTELRLRDAHDGNPHLVGFVRRRQQYKGMSLAPLPRLPQLPQLGFTQAPTWAHEVIGAGLPDYRGETRRWCPLPPCAKAGLNAGDQAVLGHRHHGGTPMLSHSHPLRQHSHNPPINPRRSANVYTVRTEPFAASSNTSGAVRYDWYGRAERTHRPYRKR